MIWPLYGHLMGHLVPLADFEAALNSVRAMLLPSMVNLSPVLIVFVRSSSWPIAHEKPALSLASIDSWRSKLVSVSLTARTKS